MEPVTGGILGDRTKYRRRPACPSPLLAQRVQGRKNGDGGASAGAALRCLGGSTLPPLPQSVSHFGLKPQLHLAAYSATRVPQHPLK